MTYRKSTPRDPDALQARIEALQATQAAGIAELVTSDAWRRYLDFQGKFHRYSFGNTLLIAAQMPTATRVMPYGTRDKKTGRPLSGWLSVGRHVKGPDPVTGEKQHGLQIWTPRTRMVDVTDAGGAVRIDPATGKPKRREQLYGWGIGYVFDVSQTEGEPLPEVVNILQGEDDAGLFATLADVAASLGFPVRTGDTGSANGYTTFGPDEIVISENRPPLQQVKTLAHELGHALMHRGVDYQGHRGKYELEAESVAYVVLGVLGIDTSDYTFGYVAGWQHASADPAGAEKVTEAIKASGEVVAKTSRKIVDMLDEVASSRELALAA